MLGFGTGHLAPGVKPNCPVGECPPFHASAIGSESTASGPVIAITITRAPAVLRDVLQ